MPNRIIKESICTSEKINTLKPFDETFYYRLIVNCDDYGRMDARPKILKAKLYPLKDNVTVRNIEDSLNGLASIGLVNLYEIDGKPFLFLPTWANHQQVRSMKSKYPEPKTHLIADDIRCDQVISDVPVIQSNTESESESEHHASHRARTKKPGKDFVPPTLHDVEAYCLQRGNGVDPKKFYDFFDAGGWVDSNGKPVLNWKQKVVTWEQYHPKKAEPPPVQASPVDYDDVENLNGGP